MMKQKREKKPANWKKELLSWVLTLGCGVLLALLIRGFVLVNATIMSGSMETTVMTGDRVFGNRMSYWTKDPSRYDMVIFLYPDDENQRFVKRIIGLPGETLELRDGLVYINDSLEPLPDDFTSTLSRSNYGPVDIPEDHYFMLGDNRLHSKDSKDWENPFVAKNKILGKLVCVYYPHPRILAGYEATEGET